MASAAGSSGKKGSPFVSKVHSPSKPISSRRAASPPTSASGKSIKLGFTFPSDATVLRREIFERIQEENRAAAVADDEALTEAIKGAGAPSAPKTESGGGS